MVFRRPNDPDWTSVDSVEKFLKSIRETRYEKIEGRRHAVATRLREEERARQSIKYFGGDFIAENIEGIDNLWERQLNSLKEAKNQGIDVKILCNWIPSSENLTRVIGEYVKAEISTSVYGGLIRGGIYDNDKMYIIERNPSRRPSELPDLEYEELHKKIVGVPQRDEDFPLQGIFTYSEESAKRLGKIFDREYKDAESMASKIERAEKAANKKIYAETNNNTEKIMKDFLIGCNLI